MLRLAARAGFAQADPGRRLPGRGAWVHPTKECIAKAEPRLRRALRVSALDTSQLMQYAELDSTESQNEGMKHTMDN